MTPLNSIENMVFAKEDLYFSLQKFFGFDRFKGNQEEIIQSVLSGRDTFVILPTGGGKSLCYQLPALMLEGTAIIISPLIALMKNQVDSIRGHSQTDEIAHFLNSSLSKVQMKQVKQDIADGKTKMLFIAPETLTKDENIEFFQSVNVSFVAVDEAHCISEWGHDFRPEYRRIKAMLDAIRKEVPLVALTATATPKVQSDIVKNLDMRGENIFIDSFNRTNLYYEIRPKLQPEQTIKHIVQIIKAHPNQSGIVYVQSRRAAEEIAKTLLVNDVKAAPYHAGLDPKVRSKTQDNFLMEDIDIIVATIAFGMGIDNNRAFFEHCRRILRPGGVFATQSESPEAFRQVHLDMVLLLREVFGQADPMYGWVPMYPSGWWSWTFAARDGRPYLLPQADRAASVAAGCEIWSPRWQRGAFEAVPAAIERALNA